jgi:hypothetical protein
MPAPISAMRAAAICSWMPGIVSALILGMGRPADN